MKNLQSNMQAKKHISRDDINNLCAMATEFENFFWQTDVFPTLDVIIGLKDILDMSGFESQLALNLFLALDLLQEKIIY